MPNEDTSYTLWTITQKSWSNLFQGSSLTEEIAEKLQQANCAEDKLGSRLTPYNTPVTEETLRQSVR